MTERKRKKLEWELALLQAESRSFRFNFEDDENKSIHYFANFLMENNYNSDFTDDELISEIQQWEQHYKDNPADSIEFWN